MAKQITLRIPLKGIARGKTKPTFETSGFTGTACTEASGFLTRALGVVQSDTPTAEMYEEEQVREHLREGDGA